MGGELHVHEVKHQARLAAGEMVRRSAWGPKSRSAFLLFLFALGCACGTCVGLFHPVSDALCLDPEHNLMSTLAQIESPPLPRAANTNKYERGDRETS